MSYFNVICIIKRNALQLKHELRRKNLSCSTIQKDLPVGFPMGFNISIVQSYFRESWNLFDFVTVVGSIVDALMVEFAVSKRGSIKTIRDLQKLGPPPPFNGIYM